ncbi:MAG: hypothetical protein QOH61_725 [Chloroflexota bacterium]|jgi:hypothetical protein|nr:hypothetical protein [Chloroflexota bacterium]
MHTILDVAAVGAVFLVGWLAPLAAAGPDAVRRLEPSTAAMAAVALGVGGVIALVTPAVLELGLRFAGPLLAWMERGEVPGHWRVNDQNVSQAPSLTSLGSGLDRRYVARTVMLHDAPATLVTWTAAVRREAQASVNGGVALVVGTLVAVAWAGPRDDRVLLGLVAIGALAVLNGYRRHRDAQRVEDLWLDVSAPAPA